MKYKRTFETGSIKNFISQSRFFSGRSLSIKYNSLETSRLRSRDHETPTQLLILPGYTVNKRPVPEKENKKRKERNNVVSRI